MDGKRDATGVAHSLQTRSGAAAVAAQIWTRKRKRMQHPPEIGAQRSAVRQPSLAQRGDRGYAQAASPNATAISPQHRMPNP